MEYTAESIRKWLLTYAWAGTPDERAAEIDCIMAQDGWKHLAARVERIRGQAWDAEQATEAEEFELSALYECHDAPHLPTCPNYRAP